MFVATATRFTDHAVVFNVFGGLWFPFVRFLILPCGKHLLLSGVVVTEFRGHMQVTMNFMLLLVVRLYCNAVLGPRLIARRDSGDFCSLLLSLFILYSFNSVFVHLLF